MSGMVIVGKAVSPNTLYGSMEMTVTPPAGIIGRAVGEKTLILPAKDTLENTSWADIDTVAKAGMGPEYWNIGDTKSVPIGGTTYYAEIIGFNHDDLADGSGKARITFDLTNSLAQVYALTGSNTNAGGWQGCAFRNTLQSTIFAQLPSVLQAVIKTVKKYTSAGSKSPEITTSQDTLFLLSQIEVDGSTSSSFAGEGTQYAHFVTQSNRIKSTGSGIWWLRSPYATMLTNFVLINASGYASTGPANYTRYINFGFCV